MHEVARLAPEIGIPRAITRACVAAGISRRTAQRYIRRAKLNGQTPTIIRARVRDRTWVSNPVAMPDAPPPVPEGLYEVVQECLELYRNERVPGPISRPEHYPSKPSTADLEEWLQRLHTTGPGNLWRLMVRARGMAAIVTGRTRMPSWLDRLARGASDEREWYPLSTWHGVERELRAMPDLLREGLPPDLWRPGASDTWLELWESDRQLGEWFEDAVCTPEYRRNIPSLVDRAVEESPPVQLDGMPVMGLSGRLRTSAHSQLTDLLQQKVQSLRAMIDPFRVWHEDHEIEQHYVYWVESDARSIEVEIELRGHIVGRAGAVLDEIRRRSIAVPIRYRDLTELALGSGGVLKVSVPGHDLLLKPMPDARVMDTAALFGGLDAVIAAADSDPGRQGWRDTRVISL